jgi:hypothetical protein
MLFDDWYLNSKRENKIIYLLKANKDWYAKEQKRKDII